MRKIVFIGPESTGKTTLAASMAKYYQSAFVPEFSRLYAEKVKRPLTYDDVKPIIEGQLKLETPIVRKITTYYFLTLIFYKPKFIVNGITIKHQII